jgi:hypothetical protein
MDHLKEHQENSDICPFCGRTNIDYFDQHSNEKEFVYMGACGDCDHQWEDVYKYTETRASDE